MYRAYRDALHIIRGLWESDDKEFSYQGDVQRVQDIEFGPVPKRRIPIMTGSMGPQSLRLTAELADGISVSSSHVPVKNLLWFREQLDRGAVELGRNSQELFINFNIMGYIHDQGSSARPRKKGVFWGDVAWWKDRLAAIKAMGVSRFTYWPVHGDFNDQLRIFIEDVAPDLR
jgi:alkanesulfonate monooxygenase SsuD/methylene tetrahydromethanopterin reductase-like flavin-dependent oxidoreductase (luciferase family)